MRPTSPQNADTPSELRALTGLRFFAAFLVVIHHYLRPALTGAPRLLDNIAANGFSAVGLFFLLSGFVLAWRYVLPSGEFRGSARRFWLARWARIYPAYMLAFLLSAPFVVNACLRVNPLRTGILKLGLNGLLSLGLLQSWTPWTAWYWNTPAWSLSVEAFFYLSFPLFAPLIGRMNKPQLLGAAGALWIAVMLLPAALLLTGHRSADSPPLPFLQALLELSPLFRLPEFLVGMLLGRYFSLGRLPNRTLGGLLLSLAGLVGCVLLLAMGSLIPRIFFSAGLLLPFSSLLLLGLARGQGWLAAWFASPALVFLGEASYGVYILQWPLAHLFGMPSGTPSWFEFAVFSAVLITGAGLSLKYLERPVRKAVLQRFRATQSCGRPPRPIPLAAAVPVAAAGELS